jgi:Flp pilus assembly protein TadG
MRWLLARLTRFRQDRCGIAAMEFAIIVPVLLLMELGAIEFSAAIRAQMQVDQIAHTIANLIADQQPSVPITALQLQDYLLAGQTMFNYGALGQLSISAASISYTHQDQQGNLKTDTPPAVGWDASNAANTGYAIFPSNMKNTALNAIPAGVAGGLSDTVNNDSVIVVAVVASITLPFLPGAYGKVANQLSFETVAFARPRYQLQIAKGF